MLKLQYDASEAFANLYKPIEPPPDPEVSRHQPAQTPAKYMQKCLGLQKEYSDEKSDLAQEIELISTKLLRPAEEAKQHTKLLQKTIKHRENMKLDYERYLGRAEHVRNKDGRSQKEEIALQTHEANLAQAQISYQTADDQVRQTFPPVSAAIKSLLPYLLASQVILQTTLVGQLYTILDAYTKRFGFPNPPPADAEIIATWDREFTSLRKELEGGISTIANGKAVHLSMTLPAEKDKSTLTGLGIRNKGRDLVHRKGGNQSALPQSSAAGAGQELQLEAGQGTEEYAPPKPPRPGGQPSASMPSAGNYAQGLRSPSMPMPSPSVNMASKPRISSNPTPTNGGYDQPPPPYPTSLTPGYLSPTPDYATGDSTPSSRYQTPVNGAPSPLTGTNPGNDYFGNRRASTASSIASSAASIAAGKKKPPPPVPTKRVPSQPVLYVTALFDFEGQNPGDLAFREGDRIRVVKKSESTDDWWDGELRGRLGSFPANYVQT